MWKTLLNNLLRLWIKTGLFFFFSDIKTKGESPHFKNKAVILVANHQNALLDALLIATQFHFKPYFLTRASVFSIPSVAKFLALLRMIPIYRIRDGFSSIKKNEGTFRLCEKILAQNRRILIFPEGNHSLKRNLRPLTKGFIRIASTTLYQYPDLELVILPIGINYQAHQKSGSKVFIQIGDPIKANDYGDQDLMLKTEQKLKDLITHVPNENYWEHVQQLIDHKVDLTQPQKVKDFLNTEKEKWVEKDHRKSSRLPNIIFKFLHFPLWMVWKAIKRKTKDPVFYATVKFFIGILGVPVLYGLVLFLGFVSGQINSSLILIMLQFLSLIFNRNHFNDFEIKHIQKAKGQKGYR